MSVGPLLPGRLPSSLSAERLRLNLQTSTALLQRLQDQAATGQKFLLPGESPAAAVRSIVLQKAIERQEQYRTSVQTATSFLAASEQSLASIGDALNRAKSIMLAGVGDNATATERVALADETATLIRSAVDAANSQFRGRYLFGGSRSDRPPFALTDSGAVVYRGDGLAIDSHINPDLLLANNVDGRTAFAPIAAPAPADLDPALTLETQLADLHGGTGVRPGPVRVTLTDGVTTQTATVDLSTARSIGDVKARLEDAFAAGPLTLTAGIDPGTSSGLLLTASAGATVAVADLAGSTVAADLGIVSAAAATINGGDLDPRLTLQTSLASLNGGAGIGATAGTGLRITLDGQTVTVDLDGTADVEDLLNRLQATGLELLTEIDPAGRGLVVGSRLSGADFAIGENGGTNATALGLRTLTGETLLAGMNGGLGVPVDAGPLVIERRDGSTVEVDLSAAATVQDVLDAVNAIDPGVLTASLNAIGNGISLLDNDGVSTGPLTVPGSPLATALGIAGAETGTDPTVPLVGADVNPLEPQGLFNVLVRLERALRAGDDGELSRLDPLLNAEAERLAGVRGEVGSQLTLLDQVGERLADREVQLHLDLSEHFDADIAEVITQATQVQATLEATLRIAAETSRLTLLSFL
jgi:flagellar hook-associated protein 3 FlgL